MASGDAFLKDFSARRPVSCFAHAKYFYNDSDIYIQDVFYSLADFSYQVFPESEDYKITDEEAVA